MAKVEHRYIDGALYARSPTPYSHDLRVHDLGHGHVEATAMPRYAWHEVDASDSVLRDAAMAQDHKWCSESGTWVNPPPDSQAAVDRSALNRERSARRSRTVVRRLVKHLNLDTMLTLTYRENVLDRSRMARDFDVFMKRVRRLFPTFQYVCVFERQKRGAWHAHIAVQKVQSHYLHKGVYVKSYDLLRAIWRAVVGEGNVDISRTRRKSQRCVAKLSSYLSKYIGKGFSNGQEGDSYRASGKALPKPTVIRSLNVEQSGAVAELCSLLVKFWPGAEFYGAYLDGGGYYASLSP